MRRGSIEAENESQRADVKRRDSKTAMGVAITILAAGIVVQVTDGLNLFGHNSVVPLIIGGIVIVIGLLVVVVMYRMEVAKKATKMKK
jgi:divalent metal cation (Fe/Co/Zn/Cd) transporter